MNGWTAINDILFSLKGVDLESLEGLKKYQGECEYRLEILKERAQEFRKIKGFVNEIKFGSQEFKHFDDDLYYLDDLRERVISYVIEECESERTRLIDNLEERLEDDYSWNDWEMLRIEEESNIRVLKNITFYNKVIHDTNYIFDLLNGRDSYSRYYFEYSIEQGKPKSTIALFNNGITSSIEEDDRDIELIEKELENIKEKIINFKSIENTI